MVSQYTALSADPDFMAGGAFVGGEYVPIADAKIPLMDWGFLRSDACQDTVSVWEGSFFRLEEHLARFERNFTALRMTCPYSRDELRDIIVNLVRRVGLRNAYVQMIMTRGRPPIGSRDPRTCANQFQVFCIPYVWIATPEKQEQGMHMHVSNIWWIPAETVSPLIKHYHWLDFEMGLFEAYDSGAETVVLSDRHGNLAEGPGFNVFVVRDGIVSTPDTSNALDGLTRQSVFDIADGLGLETRIVDIAPAELNDADEVFLSSTSGGILPVSVIDHVPVGDGKPGPVSLSIRKAYWDKRASGWHATPVSYPDGSPL